MTNPKIYEGKAIDGPLHGKWIRSRDNMYCVRLVTPSTYVEIYYELWHDGIWRLGYMGQAHFVHWKLAGHTEYTEPNKL